MSSQMLSADADVVILKTDSCSHENTMYKIAVGTSKHYSTLSMYGAREYLGSYAWMLDFLQDAFGTPNLSAALNVVWGFFFFFFFSFICGKENT
jgi:hypothetical protein